MDRCAVDELYEAFAVLAGSDPDHCSYPKGYVKRQAVFACNTCVQAGMEPAGVCLACANTCHDGHDICELYTKRSKRFIRSSDQRFCSLEIDSNISFVKQNFRCDCGNEKFHGFKCKLNTDKEGQNVKNVYNHNFFGRYCSCDRPYPDEDDQVNEEMIQCVVCEDWFHEKHLEAPAVDCDALMEMICARCMNRAPFLWTYAVHFAVSPLNKQSPCKEQTNADMTDEKGKCLHTSGQETSSASSYCQQEETRTTENLAYGRFYAKLGIYQYGRERRLRSNLTSGLSSSTQVFEPLEPQGRASSPDSAPCRLAQQPSKVLKCTLNELKAKDAAGTRAGAVFWPYFWRAKLCTCTDCKRTYVKTGVPFLLDESDTLLAYEEKAKAEALTIEELLLSCLTSLNHVQQLDIIYQYNDLKHELREFLQQSANQRKDVTPEAVREFLEELQTRKKRRLN
ncbi:hypothetical protein H4Q32_011597 [Labeo rohita]|uniref:UBR-type domain-containing protein n=1 Tax=Labeo rohita TaxID=84645 RepID=A0ABQ8LVZ0_LABRO|nr:hypothetical protein H4Q32_011597 [Labeo rohita]